jgi:hypothetical protein
VKVIRHNRVVVNAECVSRAIAASVAFLSLCAVTAGAQVYISPDHQFGARIDAIRSDGAATAQLGGEVNIAAGYYARIAGTVGVGPVIRDGTTLPSARLDLESRFHFDPFAEYAHGLYGGAGISSRWEDRSGWHEYLLVSVGYEGPVRDGWRRSIELGLGGGIRLGFVFRRARQLGR